jgi:hypothetical protein
MSDQPPLDEQFAVVGLDVADVQAWIVYLFEMMYQTARRKAWTSPNRSLGSGLP